MIYPMVVGLLLIFLAGLTVWLVRCRRSCSRLKGQADEATERYELLMTNLTAAVVIYGPNGTPLMVSPYTEVLTGYPRAELITRNSDRLAELVLDVDRPIYHRARAVVASGEPFESRFRITHRAGLTLWIESRSTPILDHDSQQTIGSLSILFDVTRMMRIQEQLETRSRDLQEFSSMLSHDLKGPIFAIKGMLGVIDEDIKDLPAPLIEPLDHIRRNTKRLEDLVGAFLTYSRLSLTEAIKEPLALGPFLQELEAEFRPAVDSVGGSLTVRSPPDLVIRTDRLKLYQILANLLHNAIKYRDPNRPLSLSLVLELLPSSDRVRCTVSDNGTGIPEHECAQIFRPFHRVPGAAGEGSGIGLATVKKLTELLGGTVQVRSTFGSGSSFEVVL